MNAVLVWNVEATLGEGPMWSVAEQALWFVDIKQGLLHRLAGDGDRKTVAIGGQPSFVLPAQAGGLVVGSGRELLTVVDGEVTGRLAAIDMPAGNRTNDATTDTLGRLWFGTMDSEQTAPHGRVYCWDGRLREVGCACPITNGPAISPDGRLLYHVDTLGGIIWRFTIDSVSGGLSSGAVFVAIDPADGWPDGVTVDAEGHLWVGLWNGWSLRRYDPSGALVATVEMPCANVTKVAFGGADLCTAYVTTASHGVSQVARANQPHAGGLFSFAAPAPGLPVVPVAAA